MIERSWIWCPNFKSVASNLFKEGEDDEEVSHCFNGLLGWLDSVLPNYI